MIRRKNKKRRENHETQDENNNAASSDYAAAMPDTGLAAGGENAVKTDLEDGEYSIQVELEGGSGKASVSSPTLMLVKEGKMYARLQWSSSNY